MVLGALAALVAFVPIVIGAVIGGSGTSTAASTTGFDPVVKGAPAQPERRRDSGIPSGPGTLVAVLRRPTTMRRSPAGRPIQRLTLRTDFGSPEVMWVVEHVPGWLGVISPIAGNGHVGWIPQATSSLTRTFWQLSVSLSARRLTVIDGGKVLAHYTVAIGRPSAPTPTGRFAVTDRLATGDPSGPYGCCVLALSAHSPHAIQGWDGGNRIAIHSTPDTSSIGLAVSHGCMRLTLAEGRWLMNHVPLGTPTLISSS
jgi:L,D-transpeptidase catalytic domain